MIKKGYKILFHLFYLDHCFLFFIIHFIKKDFSVMIGNFQILKSLFDGRDVYIKKISNDNLFTRIFLLHGVHLVNRTSFFNELKEVLIIGIN